jgi:hypothetical protein
VRYIIPRKRTRLTRYTTGRMKLAFGNHSRLLYSTAHIMTSLTVDNTDILVIYGNVGETIELSLEATSSTKVDTTLKAKSRVTKVSNMLSREFTAYSIRLYVGFCNSEFCRHPGHLHDQLHGHPTHDRYYRRLHHSHHFLAAHSSRQRRVRYFC